MFKRIISCIISTIIVLSVTIGYDRTPACRIAVMEQVPAQLGAVLPRAASYELALTSAEEGRSYDVKCFGKDGLAFRSYSMTTVEGQEDEPLHYSYTDYTYDEAGNCTDAATCDKDGAVYNEIRRTYDEKNRVLRTETYTDGALTGYSESIYTEVTNGQSSAVTTLYDADGEVQQIIRTGMNTDGNILSSRLFEGDEVTASTDNRYDSKGRLVQSLQYGQDGMTYETLIVYSLDGRTQTSRSTCEGATYAIEQRTFDENGNPLAVTQTDGDGYTIRVTYTRFS